MNVWFGRISVSAIFRTLRLRPVDSPEFPAQLILAGDTVSEPSSETGRAMDVSSSDARWGGGHKSIEPSDGNGPVGGAAKRLFDVTVALFAIVAMLPIMLIVALFYIFEGTPFYGHTRIGHGGRSFKCYKFRTMVQDGDEILEKLLADDPDLAEQWRTHRKIPNDPRVTWIGRFLRKSSLDELPQFFNVLKGDMSCVGPRPVTAQEMEQYGPFAERYTTVRPGLTGLWQISGRNELTFAERVRIDMKYIDDWSFWSDFVIMLRTPIALLKFRSTS